MNFKKFITITLLLLFSSALVFASGLEKKNKSSIASTSKPKAYPIDTSPALLKAEEEAAELIRQDPGIFERQRLKKQSAWNFNVGSTKVWKALDTDDGSYYNVAATCKAVGEHCYIFVENSQWGDRVTQEVVDNVKDAFDNTTPAFPDKGIFEVVTGVFGDPPNMDGDDKIIILILDIQDGYDPEVGGGYIAGYFSSVNEFPTSSKENSNEAEIFYMDCNPANLLSDDGLTDVLNTTAHEFQHMIHWNYHGNPERSTTEQTTFYNEGCSEISSYICGYGLRSHAAYTLNTNRPINKWDQSGDGTTVLQDYARASRYFLYLYEQFGTDFLTNFVQTSSTGYDAVNAALSQLGESRRFDDVLIDWMIANALNDKSVDTRWGYDTEVNISFPEGVVQWSTNVGNTNINVNNWAAEYITYKAGANLKFTASTEAADDFVFKAVKIGETSEVVDIQSGVEFHEPQFGYDYNTIKVIAINTSLWSERDFSFSSTGDNAAVNEISYDADYDSSFAISLSAGARQGVVFDRIEGGTLHSVKVRLRNTDPIDGNVHRLYRSGETWSVGPKISDTFTLTADSIGAWVEYEISDENIDISSDFAVIFDLTKDVSAEGNTVLVTKKPGQNFSNSIFYDPSESRWVYYVNDQDNITWLNRIRAYFTTNITGVEEIVEAKPKEFVLGQNYPNPFNPSTSIEYQVSNSELVTLKVYDILGNELKTIVNKVHSPGNYKINFDASGLPSGVYFYRLQAGEFVSSRKMILMK